MIKKSSVLSLNLNVFRAIRIETSILHRLHGRLNVFPDVLSHLRQT